MSFYNPATGSPNPNTGFHQRPAAGQGQYQQQHQQYQQQPPAQPQFAQQQQQPVYNNQQQGQQQQQQQYNNQPPAPQPTGNWQAQAATAFMGGGTSNEAMLDIGMSAGSAVAKQAMSKFVPGADQAIVGLKGYFDVNNDYVKKKCM